MAHSFRISIQAEEDTLNATDYYDNISPALGDRFIFELIETYQKIKNNPQHYSFISPDPKDKFRDVKLPSFPYVVVFEIVSAEIIVTAVLNTHRRPFIR